MKIVIVILTMFILTGCGEKRVNNIDSNIEESRIKMNTNNEVVGLKKIDGLQIEKTITYENGISKVGIDVTNISDQVIVIDYIKMTYKTDDKEVVLSMPISDPVIPNQKIHSILTTDIDLTSATSVDYEFIK